MGKIYVRPSSMSLETLIHDIIALPVESRTRDEVKLLKRAYAKQSQSAELPTNIQLLQTYHYMLQQEIIKRDRNVEQLLIKRPIRSQSWIVSVQVLTKPYWCPGKCIFCPNDFTMPKSYINTEPGAMRALLNNFDPYKQVYNRLLSLTLTGHPVDKIEMIVLGGTRDVYPNEYKEWFLKGLYDACNSFQQFFKQLDLSVYREKSDSKYLSYAVEEMNFDYPETIEESIEINETTEAKIIGLTVETRPEYVTDENCQLRRKWGVTRLEMGVQSTNDAVLDANKRGHKVAEVKAALHKLRQYGFKFSIHIMPGLYQSTLEKDRQSFVDIFADPAIKPDELKFYPTAVIPNTELYELYRSGEYKAMHTDDIKTLVKDVLLHIVPPYNRIKRLIRDIPASEIAAGSDITNLNQITHRELEQSLSEDAKMRSDLYGRLAPDARVYEDEDSLLTGLQGECDGGQILTHFLGGTFVDSSEPRHFASLDTRSREIRHKKTWSNKPEAVSSQPFFVIRQYRSSVGMEYFVAFEDELGYLYGFTRLLLPDEGQTVDFPWLGEGVAMIRELHVYGKVAKIQWDTGNKQQHRGLGARLMDMAETIARHQWYNKLTVIAGVGVKAYYRDYLGYENDGTYVSKELS